MMHDEFCPSPDPEATDCAVCMLLKMARRDERDKYDGDEEFDLELVTEDAYNRGYEAGTRAKVASPTPTTQVSADAVGVYIKDRMTTLTMQEVNALFQLYQYLGGK
jgi:hypothetical protein